MDYMADDELDNWGPKLDVLVKRLLRRERTGVEPGNHCSFSSPVPVKSTTGLESTGSGNEEIRNRPL